MTNILLEAAIRATLIAAAFALVLAALRIVSPAARHCWWTALVVVMLALPVFTAWGPRVPLPGASSTASAVAAAIPLPWADLAVPDVRQDTRRRDTAQPAWSAIDISLAIYWLGVVGFGCHLAGGMWRARQLTREATPVEGRLTSLRLATPVTIGVFRPRVVLPAGWTAWPAERLSAILAHERAHVARRDTFVQWLALLNRAIFWFHPLAWWLQGRLARLAEEACDSAVLAAGNDPMAYSEALLQCAEAAAVSKGRLRAAAMAMPGSALPYRIRRILEGAARPEVSRWRVAGGVLISVAVATVAVAATPAMPSATRLAAPLLQSPTPAVAAGSPAFDVVSIKRNPEPGTTLPLSPPVGGRLRLRNQSVRGLISSSYGVQPYQIIGGPDWLRTDGFDIDALVEGAPPPPPRQMLLMIRTLLADRFKLVMHNEQREFPIYRLVMARAERQLGPGIRPGTCVPRPPGVTPSPGDRQYFCGTNAGPGSMFVVGGTMRLLAQQLGRYAGVGRPVIDATGLTEQFQWELKWTPDSAGGSLPADGVSIFTALQEQLGVKLEPATGPIDVLVIDSVEQPEEN
ncbi:MAG: M56 family metallopeptidase [Vicinamibacterales bacterium]